MKKHLLKYPKSGFTLVELLIVVAVIALLAAISVPNFLEAQVRANIGRAKADMKSLVLATESYFVDYNEYPIPSDIEGEPIVDLNQPQDAYEGRVPQSLTTPVVYIPFRIQDPFVPFDGRDSRLYIYSTRQAFSLWETEEDMNTFIGSQVDSGAPESVLYYLASRGPDRDHEELIGNNSDSVSDEGDDVNGPALYDPSNGTVSNGDVIYFGPTIGLTR